MDHDKFTESLAAYALGALDGEDLALLVSHLQAGCETCEQELRELVRISTELAFASDPLRPSRRLRAELMGRIGAPTVGLLSAEAAVPSKQERGSPNWLRPVFAVAAVLAIATLAWSNYRLQQEIKRQETEIASMRGQLAQETNLVNFLVIPSVRVAVLEGLPPAPLARGKMIWDSSSRSGYFFASSLPVPPTDKTYQLWAIANGKPLSAGIFSVDQTGKGVLRVDPISGAENAALFAVTLEPAGGRSAPTLDQMVLRGAL